MKYKILAIIVFLLTCNTIYSQVLPYCNDLPWSKTPIYSFDCNAFEHGDWIQVYNDEFNEELNASEWNKRTPWGSHSGDRVLSYTQPQNQIVENGELKLYIKNEPDYYQNPFFSVPATYDYYLYSTAEVWSKGLFKYGKFEASISLPKGPGFVPAFWLFGNSGCGDEVDVFEFAHAETDEPIITIHKYGDCGVPETHEHCSTTLSSTTDFANPKVKHKFSVEWDELKIIFRYDDVIKRIDYRYQALNGQNSWLTNCYDVTPGYYIVNPYFPEDIMHIIFGIQIDADHPDAAFYDPNHAQGPFPSSMDIDYIRVYRRSNYTRDLVLSDIESISSAQTGNTIVVKSSNNIVPIVTEKKPLYLHAMSKINLLPGSVVELGGKLTAKINPVDISKGNEAVELNVQKSNKFSNLKSELNVYPNPTNNDIYVICDQSFLNSKFSIYNSLSMKIDERKFSNIPYYIDLSNLKKGIYYLKVYNSYSMELNLL
jgi:beta-glucanase (GH16 family)